MPDLIFYGSSDDLVEVEGVVREEYNTERQTLLVVAPDGRQARVTVAYESGGTWSVAIRPIDEDVPSFKGRVDSQPGFDGDGSYSARLTLDVPEGTKVHPVEEPAS